MTRSIAIAAALLAFGLGAAALAQRPLPTGHPVANPPSEPRSGRSVRAGEAPPRSDTRLDYEVCTGTVDATTGRVTGAQDNNWDNRVNERWPQLGKPCDDNGDGRPCGRWMCGTDELVIPGDGSIPDRTVPSRRHLVCSGDIDPGAVGVEVCDGADNDCDGLTDEGPALLGTSGLKSPQPCCTGTGACRRCGTRECDPGNAAGYQCSASPGDPATETCSGVDDDCDGSTDEGFEVGHDCAAGQGACRVEGEWACDGQGGRHCVDGSGDPVSAGEASEECCTGTEGCADLTDEDCDGIIDEGCTP